MDKVDFPLGSSLSLRNSLPTVNLFPLASSLSTGKLSSHLEAPFPLKCFLPTEGFLLHNVKLLPHKEVSSVSIFKTDIDSTNIF